MDGWDFEDVADQRDTLPRLVEAQEKVAALRGLPEPADLPELRGWLAEEGRQAGEKERAP